MAIRFELMFNNGTLILYVPADKIAIFGNDGFDKTHSIPDGSVFTVGVDCMIDPETGDKVSTGMTDELLSHIHPGKTGR